MDITLELLCKIINSFAERGKLFSNERQFQLELAWELKELGFSVYLEVLETSKMKKYIDIVVRTSPTEYVAIELKYTTRLKDMIYHIDNKQIHTFAQGNDDGRRYDYLHDVQRIEELLNQSSGVFNLPNAKVTKGFSIIMTNDKYWSTKGENTNYRDVSLYEGRKIPNKINLHLYSKKKNVRLPIILRNSYICQWHDYKLSNTSVSYLTDKYIEKTVNYSQYPFKYMILESKDN